MTRTRIPFAIVILVLAVNPGFAGTPGAKGYPFQLPANKALTALENLDQKLALTGDERSLFEAVREGKLDKWSFAETCLIASGVTDSTKRKSYVAKLDRIESEARKAIASAKTSGAPAER